MATKRRGRRLCQICHTVQRMTKHHGRVSGVATLANALGHDAANTRRRVRKLCARGCVRAIRRGRGRATFLFSGGNCEHCRPAARRDD